jgi:hypothetical protein
LIKNEKATRLIGKRQITISMSGTGNCYDNAAMESFFHTLKTEHVYCEHYLTREQAKRSIFEYILDSTVFLMCYARYDAGRHREPQAKQL